MAGAKERDWITIQQSTFTNWCNARLDSGTKIADLQTDLDDGVKLVVLLERLANRRVSSMIHDRPRNESHRFENLKIAFEFIQKKEKIHLVHIGPKDIIAHNQRPILRLIWKLILHYQIQGPMEDDILTAKKCTKPHRSPPKRLLLNWLQAAMPEDQLVKNLTSDWNNGQRLSALVDMMKPGTIPNYRKLHPDDALASTEQALDIAESELDIPKIIEPDHVCVEKPDEWCMMTYLSYFCFGKDSPGYRSLLTWVRSRIPEYNIVDFTGDWRDGRALSALVNAVAEGTLPNHASLDPSNGVDNVRAAMKMATDNLDGIKNNITPEEFADKDTRALAMMAYIEWFRKAKPKQSGGEPSICSNASKVKVEGLHDCKTDETAQFSVRTEEAGPGKPDVSVRGPTGPIPCTMEDVDKNVYQCTYTPVEAGPHIIRVLFAEEDVPGSPFTTMVSKSCYPDKVVLRDLPHGNLKVGHEHSITADTTEADSGTLSASLNGPSGSFSCGVKEEQEKIYSITFEPAKAGTYKLDVQYSGNPVHDSPVLFYAVDPSSVRVTPPTVGILGVFLTEHHYKYHVKASETVEKVTVKARGRNTGDEPTMNLTESGDGEYDITLTAAKPDDYDVDIYYGSDPVPGSPYHLQVLEKPRPDRVQCGTLVPEVPVWMSIDISKAGAGKLIATCKGDKCGAIPCTVTGSGGGEQQVSFNPPASDVYWVSVYWNNTEVPRSPFRVSTVPTDASKVRVDGPHYPQMHEGPVTAVCDVSDAGDGTLTASCHSKYGEVPVKVSDQVNEKVEVQFAPSGHGHYELNMLWQKDNVPGSPFNINLDPPDSPKDLVGSPQSNADKCKVYDLPIAEKKLVAGEEIVYGVDTSGAGAGKLTVHSEGVPVANSNSDPKITSTNGADFRIVYTPVAAGTHKHFIHWNKEAIPGSPVVFEVEPRDIPVYPFGPVTLPFVFPGIKATAISGHVTYEPTGKKLKLNVKKSKTERDKIQISFKPADLGLYKVYVNSNKVPVKGSPFEVRVLEPIDASKVRVTGLTDIVCHVEDKVPFTLDCTDAGSGKLLVRCEGPTSGGGEEATLDIGNKKNNCFDGTFSPKCKGDHLVHVRWSDKPVPDSPFKVTVIIHPDPTKVIVEELHDCKTDETAQFSVKTEEAGPGKLDVSVRGPTGPIPCTMEDVNEHAYKCKYTPVEAGPHTVRVLFSEEDVPGSPFTTMVSESCYPDKVVLQDLPHGNLKVGHEHSITADTTEAGSGTLSASLNGPSGSISCSIQEEQQKVYSITFEPTKAGTHMLEVLFSSNPVPDSPVLFYAVDPSSIRVTPPTVSILGMFLTEDPYKYHVKAPDTVEKVTAKARGRNTGDKPTVNLTESGGGEYDITLTAAKPDDYYVDIYYGSDPVPGSPFHLKIVEKPHPDRVQCGTLIPKVPVLMSVDISKAGAGKLTATCKGDKCGAVPCLVIGSGPGRQQVSFNPPASDVYWVSVYWNNTEVPRSPFRVSTVPTDASKVRVNGPHYPQMHEGPVTAVCDVSDAGDGTLTASCHSKEYGEVLVKVSDQVNEKVEVQFAPSGRSHYKLNVLWQEDNVPGSPFNINLYPLNPPKDTNKCKVYDLPNAKKKLVAGEDIVYGVDASGAVAGVGKLTVHSDHEGPSEANRNSDRLQIMTTDGADFRIVYIPGVAGTHRNFIHWNEEAIPDSPVVFEVEPRDIPVHPFGLVPMDFVFPGIRAKDVSGHVIYEPTRKKLKLTVDKSKTERDKFHVTFKPTEPGLYKVYVNSHKAPVRGSPFEVRILEPINAGKVRVTGLTDIVCHVEDKVPFALDCTDAGSGELLVRCEGPTSGGGEEATVDIGNKKNNCFDGTFSPNSEGDHLIHVRWSDKPVPDSPFKVKVLSEKVPEVDPRTTILELGQQINIKITDKAEDEVYSSTVGDNTGSTHVIVNVNFVSSPGPISNSPAISISGPNGPVHTEVNHTGDGCYIAHFKPEEEGEYLISAKCNGEHLKGSPYMVLVHNSNKSDPSKCFILSEDLEVMSKPCEFELNQPCHFRVSTVNAGDGRLELTCRGPAHAEVNISDNYNDVYTITFTPSAPGKYHLDVTWDNIGISGSPFLVVYNGEPSRVVTGLDLSNVHFWVGKPHHFMVNCGDIGEGEISVIVDPPSAATVEIRDMEKLKYDITLTPQEPGEHQVSVTHRSQHLHGSPFLCTFDQEEKAVP